jgi:hypothetical protein
MTYRLTAEARNTLVNKLSVPQAKADELLGTGLKVDEEVYQAARKWAIENTATKVEKILWGN